MKTLPVLLSAVVMLADATAAEPDQSLYRSDQPAVLNGQAERKQARAAEDAAIISAFKTAYAKAGKPKIALFWHRELSDNITSTREATITDNSSGQMPWDNYTRIIKIESKVGPERAVSLAPPARAAEFESGFQRAMRANGVSFIDREAIVRLTSMKKTQDGQASKDQDFQTLEMESLAGYAQYFAEVNLVPDPDSRDGLEPRVTVISSSTGEVIADVVPSELYKLADNDGQWVATERGFERQLDDTEKQWKVDESGIYRKIKKRTGLEEGHRVAIAVMQQMTEALEAK